MSSRRPAGWSSAGTGGVLEIAVVHRPVHQDWSFPKGKLEEGETFEVAALREVREETGMTCRLVRFIGHTEYVDRKGRPKAVAYWVMAAEEGSFTPNDEVDELRWLTLDEASDCSPTPAIRSWWPSSWLLTRSNPSSDTLPKFL